MLRYFNVVKVKNLDDRKRRITLENLLTMTSGLKWKDLDIPPNSPENDTVHVEATDDWVQFVIDRPMVAEPGKIFGKTFRLRTDGTAVLWFQAE